MDAKGTMNRYIRNLENLDNSCIENYRYYRNIIDDNKLLKQLGLLNHIFKENFVLNVGTPMYLINMNLLLQLLFPGTNNELATSENVVQEYEIRYLNGSFTCIVISTHLFLSYRDLPLCKNRRPLINSTTNF